MEIKEIKEIIEHNYFINIYDIEKIKNAYKINCKEGEYCIKIIKYEFKHFNFILSAIKHLQKKGFSKIPEILKTKNNYDYIVLNNKYAYLSKWIPSRLSNYDNPLELQNIATKLGELHKCSCGFLINENMKPRIGWYSWLNVFKTRCDEILDFKNRINQKAYKSEFDKIYLENVEKEVARGLESIKILENSDYLKYMNEEAKKLSFCHHDFAHHNVLIGDNEEINIIDFDYCILDSHLHDLSSLLIRVMKDGKWNIDKANLIIKSYCKSNDVKDYEFNIMKGFIKFPQSFWQIGLQYYWEQQPWSEESFISRLKRYLEDVDYREDFINQYFK